jgi:hypothetical protein
MAQHVAQARGELLAPFHLAAEHEECHVRHESEAALILPSFR